MVGFVKEEDAWRQSWKSLQIDFHFEFGSFKAAVPNYYDCVPRLVWYDLLVG
jgi:hypothetical protein